MGRGALLSALLHGMVILFLLIGMPELFRRELEPPPIIPIEVINIADITKASDLKVKPKDDTPEKKETKKEKPKPTPPPKKEKKPEPTKEKPPEAKPEPEAPTPTLTMDDLLKPLEKKKEKQKEEKKKEKPKEKPKEKSKKEKKKEKKKPKNDFNALLTNLEETASSSPGKTQPEQDDQSTADHAARHQGELSITELDLVRRQLAACWNVAAGARDAKDLYVDVKVEMNPDATVRTAKIIGSSGGIYARAAEGSALRAVHNPNCSPLKLPLDRYEQWKTITIRFDPKYIL